MALSREQKNPLVRSVIRQAEAKRIAQDALDRVTSRVRRGGKTWALLTPAERHAARIDVQRRLPRNPSNTRYP